MPYLGIDIGGTNIAVGLVDENGKILEQSSIPTLAKVRKIEDTVKAMCELCIQVVKKADYEINDVEGIGLGCPGTVDNKNGLIAYCNNIPMHNFKMREEIQKYINKPVSLMNDADAAAFGEYKINGKGMKDFIFITLGTGVGGGIIINGQLYTGFNGVGGEIGHITTVSGGEPCSCGKNGCWEAYASVTALIRQTKAKMQECPESKMHEIVKNYGKVSGRTAFEAAKAGDRAGAEVVDQYIKYIGDGIVSMLNVFQPEKISIGGGISREGEYLLNPLREFVYKYDYNRYMPKTKIEAATLFNDAGIIGAALFAKN